MLRPYQNRIIDATTISMSAGNRHVAVYASQGSGKSHIIADMAFRAAAKGSRTLVITHRQEVFRQNFAKMDALGLSVQQINPQTKHITDSNVYCAMAQTLRARCDKHEYVKEWMKTIDFVIIDEGHRLDSHYLLQFFRKDVWIIGMSATWMRSGTQPQLGDTYSDIVATTSTQQLIDLGYLVPSKNFAFQAPLLSDIDVERGTGDYHQAQLQKRFAKPERYAGIIDNYRRICCDEKAAVFTTGSEHCISLCKAFCDAGISAKYLLSAKNPETDGEYSDERKSLLHDFHDGKFDVLVSIECVNVGYDEPTLKCVILDFSTKSYAKYAQSVGRGSRVSQGKQFFYVLDFGANIENFGIYEAPASMALWHQPGGNGVAPTKLCDPTKQDPTGKFGCNRLVYISATDCPFCNWHWVSRDERYTIELEEVIAEVKEEIMTIAQWAASKKLLGWSTQRILVATMMKNKEHMKKAFDEARQVLRTEKGEFVSQAYYYFLLKNVINKKKVKKSDSI